MAGDIATKLAAARTRLILDKPFLGALVLRLPMIEADPAWCRTTATDARNFYYNHDYIDALSLEQTQFVLAHEALHCALSHFSRRQHRLKHRWDLACDYAINPLLLADGLQAPPGALHDERFDELTAEEIYPSIEDLEDQEPMDQHLYDDQEQQSSGDQGAHDQEKQSSGRNAEDDSGESGEQRTQQGASETQGEEGQDADANPESQSQAESQPQPKNQPQAGAPQPPPLSENERESLSVQWQQRMAGAAQQAIQAGKMGDGMARLVDHMLQPRLPWRMLLARYLTATARDDYSFQRPSRREGSAILPSLRGSQVDLLVVVDSSGSISDTEIAEFVSEIDAIKGQMRAKITLLACDDKLADNAPWIYEPWDAFEVPEDIEGGGGTSFLPPFDYVAQMGKQPDLMLYFTDADGEFPAREAPFPVIWLIKGKKPVPWGTRIQLN